MRCQDCRPRTAYERSLDDGLCICDERRGIVHGGSDDRKPPGGPPGEALRQALEQVERGRLRKVA